MPVMRCTIDGKPGYKWGESGTCYPGEDGKEKAIKQGQAIEASKSEDTEDEQPFESTINFER